MTACLPVSVVAFAGLNSHHDTTVNEFPRCSSRLVVLLGNKGSRVRRTVECLLLTSGNENRASALREFDVTSPSREVYPDLRCGAIAIHRCRRHCCRRRRRHVVRIDFSPDEECTALFSCPSVSTQKPLVRRTNVVRTCTYTLYLYCLFHLHMQKFHQLFSTEKTPCQGPEKARPEAPSLPPSQSHAKPGWMIRDGVLLDVGWAVRGEVRCALARNASDMCYH